MKKEVWPKYQGENLETKGESSSSGLPSKPGLAVKDFPELGVTSAFQKVTLVRGRLFHLASG